MGLAHTSKVPAVVRDLTLDVAPAAAAWREGGRDYHRGIAWGICDGPPQVSSIPLP
jgi:hypothetical protein